MARNSPRFVSRLVSGVALAALFSGCIAPNEEIHPSGPPIVPAPSVAGSALPSASRAPAISDPTVAPSISVEPTVPASLERTASVEENGIRLTIELERNPMPAGEPTWATATLTNTGPDDLIWFHGGCSNFSTISGMPDGDRWRPGEDPAADRLRSWKRFLLGFGGQPPAQMTVEFTPEPFIGKGSIVCTLQLESQHLASGASMVERAQWNGLAFVALTPPPSGPLDLRAVAGPFLRASDPEREGGAPGKDLELHLHTWVVGDGRPWLHPGEAIDAAFADPAFVSMLGARSPGDGNQPLIRFDPASGRFMIGILDSQPAVDRARFEVVDGITGEALGYGERVWDFQRDGNP